MYAHTNFLFNSTFIECPKGRKPKRKCHSHQEINVGHYCCSRVLLIHEALEKIAQRSSKWPHVEHATQLET